jgi:hypothetical protein
MAGVYTKIKKINFRNGKSISYGSSGSNGIIDSDWVYVQNGTDSTAFPKESIANVDMGATVAHLDTALSSADALFT